MKHFNKRERVIIAFTYAMLGVALFVAVMNCGCTDVRVENVTIKLTGI